MLTQTKSLRYWQLIETGYKPDQILTCPRGDPCWCEVSIAQGHGYVKDCGMTRPVMQQLGKNEVQK